MMTLGLLAYLIKLFGPTLARMLLATLLKDRVDFAAIGYGDIAETLADSLDIGGLVDKVTDGDRKAVRNANYLFDKIGDEAAEKLAEVFQRENGQIDEAEWRNTIDAAKETLNRHGLSLLIQEQLNAHDFRRALRNTPPTHPLETRDQEELYRRLLDSAAQVIFAIADTLPHFTRDTTAQLLQNEARLLQDMETVLSNQQRILAESYGQKKGEVDQQFESEYRNLIASELDNLQLFGVESFDGAKQPLSVAYIRLRVSMNSRGKSDERNRGVDIEPNEADISIDGKSLPVEQALSTHQRLLIESEAGSGKTTLLQWIAVQAARHGFAAPLDQWAGRLPFFIRLREFAKSPLPTFGQLATAIRELKAVADSVPDQWVEQQLRAGRAIVLIDGMDEVSNAKRLEAIEWLERLLRLYANTIVIVSSRPAGITDPVLQQALARLTFHHIKLLPLDNQQKLQFVEQWHMAMGDEHCHYADKSRIPLRHKVLLTALEKRKEINDLAKTPILCSMLCALNLFELGELPKDRIRLYDRCINILLRRDENREVDSSDYTERLRPDNVRRRLARIAYWMLQNDPAIIYRQDAERLLHAEGLTAGPVLDFLSARSVVFRSQAVDEFDFIHRTFMEFLAAQEIVRANEVKKVGQEYGARPEWHGTIRLLAAHVEPSDQAKLLHALYLLAQAEPKERNMLHFLAWDFWDLLDARTEDALQSMVQHLDSLTLRGANGLNLMFREVSDVSALAQLSNLQQLNLSSTQVSDVSALAQLSNLQQLDLSRTQVSDVSALAQLSNLQELYLSSTQVSDVSALRKMLPKLMITS